MASVQTPILRSKDTPARVIDEATRYRRKRRALEALEQDNFQEDPHADLVMHKKAPKFDETPLSDTPPDAPSLRKRAGAASTSSAAGKAKTIEFLKQKFRKTFHVYLEEDREVYRTETPHWESVQAGASMYPPRHFCSVCGFLAAYTCVTCGARFCRTECSNVHKETRCLKHIA